jgi:uncharacterized protein (DUF433 family)
MNWQEFIHSDPDVLGGKPSFRGTRYSVERVLKLVAAGWNSAQISEEFPGIETQHVQAAAGFAAQIIREEDYISSYKAKAA